MTMVLVASITSAPPAVRLGAMAAMRSPSMSRSPVSRSGVLGSIVTMIPDLIRVRAMPSAPAAAASVGSFLRKVSIRRLYARGRVSAWHWDGGIAVGASFDGLRMRHFSQWRLAYAILDLPHPEPVEGRTSSCAAISKANLIAGIVDVGRPAESI